MNANGRSHIIQAEQARAEMVRADRILVIRFGVLGDIILALPAIARLRVGAPAARVDIAVKSEYSSLFRCGSLVDGVFPLESSAMHAGLRGMQRYAEELSGESFDLVVDLHSSVRSRLITRLLKVPRVLRVRSRHLRRRALVNCKRPLWGFPGHIVDRYLETLGPPVGDGLGRIPRFTVAGDTRRHVDEVLQARGVAGGARLVALAPGAGRKTKQWPEERYAALAARLAGEESQFVVLVGSEEEGSMLERISELANQTGVVPFSSSDLPTVAGMISRASCLVANDTGLMHMAAAVDTPVVALFGPTTPSLGFRPLGLQDRVVSVPLRCRPCSLHGLDRCPRGDHACMQRISVDRVFKAVELARGENTS